MIDEEDDFIKNRSRELHNRGGVRVITGGEKEFVYSKEDMAEIENTDTDSSRNFKTALRRHRAEQARLRALEEKRRKRNHLILAILIIAVVLFALLYFLPQILHPQCVINGGYWRTFPDTCVDNCNIAGCGEAFTPGCDCGPDQCWNEERCVDNRN